MRIFVKNYVRGCAECQQFKINRQPIKPTLIPNTTTGSMRPFAFVTMDVMSGLPPIEDHGVLYDAILIQVDKGLTGGVILMPCNCDAMVK